MEPPQPSLFDRPVARPARPARRSSIDERFVVFHRTNPAVYDELVRLAREARALGFEQYSVKTLIEVVRWQSALETAGDPFKINNSYASRYARLIKSREADLADFFFTRELKS
jgi:hypothetical protein